MFSSPELEDSIFHIHMKEDGIYAEQYNGVLYSSMLPDEGCFYTDSNNSLININIGGLNDDNE